MANKRMFSLKIVDSDAFLDLPLSAQALYFHIGMRADDDGFLNNAKSIQRLTGASEADLNDLIDRKFLLRFPSGVICVKHWLINNTIKADRHQETAYSEEKAMLKIKDNKAYTLHGKTENKPAESTGKGSFHNVNLSETEYSQLKERYKDAEALIEKVSTYLANARRSYKNHFALCIKIAEEDGWIKRWAGEPVMDEPLPMDAEARENRDKLKDIVAGIGAKL